MSQTVYNYDPITRTFTGASQADESPLEPGVYLIPAHATTIEPPAVADGKVARYRPDDVMWELVPDIRGTWYDADGQAVQIDSLDADVSTLTRDVPPDNTSMRVDGAWVPDPAKVASAAKATADAAVTSGMAEAARQIAVLQDAVDLGMATDAEAALYTDWRRYRVLLSRVQSDAKYPDVTLPQQPEKVLP